MNKALAELNALCIANAQDVIGRLYSDTDKDIENRYETEENGVNVALKYIELAERANRMCIIGEFPTTMKISQPDKDGNRIFKEYVFSENAKEFEKQIARRPLIGGNTNKLGDVYICPNCCGIVGNYDMRGNYCADCGQKIDWNEINAGEAEGVEE